MKKNLLFIAIALFSISLLAQEEIQVIAGAGYANDVYYSLDNGIVDTVARNWDIAFAVPPISLGVSVLTNGGSEVELYSYTTGDTASWATLDTTGMVWNSHYNSLETFEEGAFSANASVHPDYGWGTYGGMGVITGDSLYVIKTVAGTYKKIAIIVRNAAVNLWEFKYANLDGSDEQVVAINTADNSDNFIYYSLDTQEELDREPASEDWDLLFTKFWDNSIPFSVTGILTNDHKGRVLTQEVSGSELDQATFVDYNEEDFSSNISTIGSDWKSFNMGTFTWEWADTVVYFIKKYSNPNEGGDFQDSAYFKIYFTGFTGTSEGKYTFMQETIRGVFTGAPELIQLFEIYPNPASNQLNVVFDHLGETGLSIVDITGRTCYSDRYEAGGMSNVSLNISDLRPGMYFLKLDAGNESQVLRFVKR